MNDQLLKGSILDYFFNIWNSAQIPLYETKRWGAMSFLSEKDFGLVDIRSQSVLEHIHCFDLFVDTSLMLLNPHIIRSFHAPLNSALVQRCCKVHDHPEGLLKRDIRSPKKTEEDDLKEYEAFVKHIKVLPLVVQKEFERAYLLQFATEIPSCFPEEVKNKIREIAKANWMEALFFKAGEKFEYLFYPFKIRNYDSGLLSRVIKDEIEGYRNYAQILPGFREEIFTENIEKWLIQFSEEHK